MYRTCIKGLIDYAVSSLAIVIMLPFFLSIILIYLCHGKVEFLFKQPRVGKDESIFNIIKFKTIVGRNKKFTFGTWLRNYSLDETPQLLNVLKGEMSLVGPRPLLKEYLPLYNAVQRKRHQVKPGITGLSQINGRNTLEWTKRFELDVYYVENYSFPMDLKIMIKTFSRLINSKDILPDFNEKFKGAS